MVRVEDSSSVFPISTKPPTLYNVQSTGVRKSLECAGAWRGKSAIFDSESLSVLCDTDKAVQFWNAWREGIRVALGTAVALN